MYNSKGTEAFAVMGIVDNRHADNITAGHNRYYTSTVMLWRCGKEKKMLA